MDSNTHSTSPHQQGWERWWPRSKGSSTKKGSTAWATAPWPNGSWPCGGCWTASKATGSRALADLDGRGAAGAEHGVPAASTAAWLRHRLRMGAGTAAGLVRTARALHRGPLTGTARALAAGDISPAHAQVLAAGTHDLPDHLAADAEPVLVAAARRLDPPRLRRVVAQLRLVADPDRTDPRPNSAAAAGVVAGGDLGGHGRRQRAAGPGGRPEPAGGPGAAGPPGQRRRRPQRQPASGRCPGRAGPP